MRADHLPYLAGTAPRAFAHRGWHLGDLAGMENSLSALRRAVAEGFRYLEVDVRASADSEVFVHHDATLDRTTDAAGAVAALPARAVRAARIGGREAVSSLAEVLEELPQAHLNIDVKADDAVAPTVAAVLRAGAADRVALTSFDDARLRRLRRLAPAVATGMSPGEVRALWLDARLRVLPTRWLTVGAMAQVPVRHGGRTVVTPAFVTAAHRAGAEVHVWTVDEPGQMRQLLGWGVDGLVTDRPDLLRQVLAERGQWG